MEATEIEIVFSRLSNKIMGLIIFGLIMLVWLYEGYDHPEAFHGDTFKVFMAYLFFVGLPLFLLHALYRIVFRTPNAIILDGAARTIRKTYPIAFLAPAARRTRFDEWEGVQSFNSGGAAVTLALRACSGGLLILDKTAVKLVQEPGFWPNTRGITEPTKIRDLRLRIAALTGLKDYGYTDIQLDDPAYDKIRKRILPP
jgi:hypothetical protein